MPTEKHDTQVVDDAAAQERETLIDEFAFRGTGQASCIYMAAPWHLVQRAGIDPRSHLGRGLRWLFSLTWPFLGALIVGLVAGGLSAAAILSWAAVAIVFACGTIWEPAAYSDPQAIDVGLLRAMADTQALRVLVARERWWGLVRFALASLGFAVVLAALVVASPWGDWSKVPPGSTFLLAVLYYWVGEMIMFGLFNVGTNRYLADQRYELHAAPSTARSSRCRDRRPRRGTPGGRASARAAGAPPRSTDTGRAAGRHRCGRPRSRCGARPSPAGRRRAEAGKRRPRFGSPNATTPPRGTVRPPRCG